MSQSGYYYSAVPLFISIVRTLMPVQVPLRVQAMITRLPLIHVRLSPSKLTVFHGKVAHSQVPEQPLPPRHNPLILMKLDSKAGNVSCVSDSYWRI